MTERKRFRSQLRPVATVGALPLVLLFLGFAWAISSPQGSSADEGFHTANIYCAAGASSVCQWDPETGTYLVPEYIIRSNCYVDFPAFRGAGCVKSVSSDLVEAPVLMNTNTYSPLYFKTMHIFVGDDYPTTVLLLRAVNVILASILLLWALAVSTPAVKRGLALSWGLALVPVGIFFIASVNPSAWLIAAVGTYWAFLTSILTSKETSKRKSWLLWAGLVVSVIMAVGSRTDGVLYLGIVTVSLLIWKGKGLVSRIGRPQIIASGLVVIIGLSVGASFFLSRFSGVNFSFPGAQTGTDQPNAIIKNLVEVPAFLLGLLGGQGPQVGLSTGATNEVKDGFTHSGFYYGIGWMDFSLPPLVSIIAGMTLAAFVFLAMRQYNVAKFFSLVFLVVSVITLILLTRGLVAFTWGSHIQPRYIYPIFLAGLGLALTVGLKRTPLINRLQAVFAIAGITFAASVAWLATATRYAVGPNAAYTNFGQTPEWWWNIGPGRLGWFLITLVISALWAFASIWVWGRMSRQGNRPTNPVMANT